MKAEESPRSRSWIAPLLLFILLGASLGSTVGTPLRDADFVDIDLYSRFAPLEVFTTSHLRAERVHFYRPLSDFVDVLMVRAFGDRPWAYHVTLLGLIWINALLLARLVGRLVPGSRPAGWLAAALYVTHPLQHGTLAYFEGGCAHITYLLFTLLFLHAALGWRETGGRWRATAAGAALTGACLCFDGGLALPVAWFILTLPGLLPPVAGIGRRRRWLLRLVPLAVLGPVLVARKLVIGVFGGGYGLPLTRELIVEGPAAFARVLGRIAYPAPPAVREATELPVVAPWILAIVLALLVVVTLLTSRKILRAAITIALLEILVCLPALPDFVSETIRQGEFPFSGSYRLSVPMALGSAVIALLLLGAARGCRVPRSLATSGTVILVVLYMILGGPIGEANRRAGEIADDVRRGIREQVSTSARRNPVFLVDTPLRVRLGNIVVMRIFQVGLSSSLRPPLCDRDLRVYPLLIDRGGLILRPGATDTLAARDDLTLLSFDHEERRVVPYRRSGLPALPEISIEAPRDGATVQLEQGAFEVILGPCEVHHLVLVMLNRVQPFYFSSVADPRANHHLALRVRDDGRIVAPVGGPILREVLGHFPDDPLFFYVEDLRGREAVARSRLVRIEVSGVR